MQTVAFTYFELPRVGGKWFAFRNMGLGVEAWGGAPPGAEWLRLLGSGGRNGFGLWPNWGGYALMAAFPDEVLAHAALDSPLWRAYADRAASAKTFLLRPERAHGAWDGAMPFRCAGEYERDTPTVVLTRATIRKRHIPAFWRRVRRVSESVADYPERTFSVGVGELPVVQQATLSHWTSGRAMEDYAYRSRYHAEVVRLTRERGWYREELFCRFGVLARPRLAVGQA